MRSRTETPTATSARVYAERAARVVAVVALLSAWWLTGRPTASNTAALNAAATQTEPARIAQLVANPQRTALHTTLRAVPDAEARAVLHAAGQAGLSVSWGALDSAAVLTHLAMSVSPLADPEGGSVVRVSAPNGVALSLEDSLGWIDSAVVTNGGVTWPLNGAVRALSVSSASSIARAIPLPVEPLKRIRMIAAPGWEAQFAMRALEDAGWSVDASFRIAPRVDITSGTPAPLDTSQYAAVVALDSTAWSSAGAIAAFVRSGGGLVLFPGAASGSAMAGVRAGGVGAPSAGIPGAFVLVSPREGLLARPIIALRSDAVVLERSTRPGSPVVMAARRVGAGRVVQLGWENSWEWRMLGGDNAVAEHRAWWRGLMHRAATVSVVEPVSGRPLPGDAAPYADLVARIGASSEAPADVVTASTTPAPPPPWLFGVLALALLAEWWSRRLRGVR